MNRLIWASSHLLLIALVCAMVCATGARAAISIACTGDWSVSVTSNDLTGGAGSNLTSVFESVVDQAAIQITGALDNSDNWRVDAKRSDTNWPAGFTLFARRSGDGSGGGSISGGAAYQEVTSVDATLFSGAGDRANVGLQFKVTGVSVSVAPATYSTSIVYTVVDTP